MKNIKETIIHWLGGYTIEEKYADYLLGKANAFCECKWFADELYGKNAEEWCEEMYDFLKRNTDAR